jgi:hypothetical protein
MQNQALCNSLSNTINIMTASIPLEIQKHKPISFTRSRHLQSTVADGDLSVLSLNAAELLGLTIGKVVHSRLGEVEAVASMVHSKNVYCLAVISHAVAGTALFKLVSNCNSGAANMSRTWGLFQPATPE